MHSAISRTRMVHFVESAIFHTREIKSSRFTARNYNVVVRLMDRPTSYLRPLFRIRSILGGHLFLTPFYYDIIHACILILHTYAIISYRNFLFSLLLPMFVLLSITPKFNSSSLQSHSRYFLWK